MKSAAPAIRTKTLDTSSSYKVGKMTFIIERKFREDAESLYAILARLIKNDPKVSSEK